MSSEFDVHYGEEEFRTVDAGIEAIEAVLTGEILTPRKDCCFILIGIWIHTTRRICPI